MDGQSTKRLMALWAKSQSDDPKQRGYHPLPYHLIDVAMVAEVLWDRVLTPEERVEIARRLALSEEEAKRWVMFLAGSHDIGKCSPSFQHKETRALDRLAAAGYPVAAVAGGEKAPHGMVTAQALWEYLGHERGVPAEVAETLAIAIGGHHGSLPTDADIAGMPPAAVGKKPWTAGREELVAILASLVSLPSTAPTIDDVTALWLAGFVSVVDWIGSSQHFFPFGAHDHAQTPPYDPGYVEHSRLQAEKALRELGWLTPATGRRKQPFEDMFHYEPNAMQQAVIGLESQLDEPGLVIIEAPMGEGKTEAALWLADRWGSKLGQRGFYVALPTQATSNQMFDRITAYLQEHHRGQHANVQLLHGHAALSAAFQEMRREGYRVFRPADVDRDDGRRGAVAAAEWFTYRKRGLLAPYGVGTIDQVLLAILQTRHVFVRLFGLAYKTVIIDEVHAYDAYMSQLLEQLLRWLGALGSSVVLLSATLPDARRRSLAIAYRRGALGMRDATPVPSSPYPRVTIASGRYGMRCQTIPTAASARKDLSIRWIDPLLTRNDSGLVLGRLLQEALKNGGVAAVICNTVRRAQEVYQLLKEWFSGMADDGEPEIDLLHARFLYEDRAIREQRTLRRFGKPGATVDGKEVRRPHRAILVSTQIIEQSLDLDFDLMVTDLAPVDLLLQRAGRLGRHTRDHRPLDGRTLWIAGPKVHDEVPEFDAGSAAVYFPHILLRTWLAIGRRQSVQIPGEVEGLIESVYGDLPESDLTPRLRELLNRTHSEMTGAVNDDVAQALMRHIKPPGTAEYLYQVVTAAQEEDSPQLHPGLQALTRLTEPTVTLIVLDGHGGAPMLDGQAYDPCQTPRPKTVARLLERSVSVSDRRVVHALRDRSAPPGWRDSAMLRFCRLVVIPAGGEEIGKCLLRLDRDLGLMIENKEEVIDEL